MANAEANRLYFDSVSDSYDSKPWFAKVNQQVADSLRSDLSWVGIPFANTGSPSDATEVRLLDYACGTGLMTRVFGPYVTKTQGIDVSPNMVSSYNNRAREANLSEATVNAVVGNLFDKSDPSPSAFSGPEWQNFDLATVGFGFHHFEDVVHSARQLKERLRPGGVLVINDFLEGGDLLADENGDPLPDSQGTHAIHNHNHGHGHDHDRKEEHKHEHKHEHEHGHRCEHHHHHKHEEKKHDIDDTSLEFHNKMNASIVVPHFSIEGVKRFLTEAGFIDIDVTTMKERVYMMFEGKKIWRTILFAKGRKPVEGKSEL
ncbi:S-adenosyl-L-methionine-dependent methyltransferase [Cucurbitaria berberidis CBS 394.84]|uniref:S-adenosyl-L-methionine-dependent methyltransferase n=1 Tax=Cucurbitaria berberidis CBS 394.84 TaxID=1168544 RepID=A0A9P4LF64_9PLEO|nr:S-adenosyl-L-methionine-dependent methyltransferase [Cucurbitaria berberidis CBS 394.84]KAF1851764.1 S-adenosyl-L-methionine-dependent methyltransferase [Cucurbitaria berberidis CBS 394.84]